MDHACDYRTFQPQQPIRFLCALLPYWQPLVSWTTAIPDKSKLIPAITILQPLSKNGKELTAAFWLTANQCLYWGARLYKSGNVVDMITSYFLLWFSLPTARPPWFGHMSMFIGVCFFYLALENLLIAAAQLKLHFLSQNVLMLVWPGLKSTAPWQLYLMQGCHTTY